MDNNRNRIIIRTSIIGIAANLLLAVFKAAVGLIANSIAIILDAVNNLSDAVSSVITIIGTKLSGKKPDKKHPYGHGRIEYITSLVIAVIVLLAGVSSFRESFLKVIHPEHANYSVYSLIIISAAVIIKFFMGRYVRGVGKKINSQSLVASGTDAFFDAVLSFSTLIGAVLSIVWKLDIEGFLGLFISIIIIKAGVDILRESLASIIGMRADSELTKDLREKVEGYDGVLGVYDLMLHNYGPSKIIGTLHIAVDDNMTARDIHKLSHKIQTDVYLEFGIILTVGIYASNTTDEFAQYKKIVENAVSEHPEIIQMHGFFVDEETKHISFDIIVDFEFDAQKICEEIAKDVSQKIPEHKIDIILDTDFSD